MSQWILSKDLQSRAWTQDTLEFGEKVSNQVLALLTDVNSYVLSYVTLLEKIDSVTISNFLNKIAKAEYRVNKHVEE